MSQPEQTSGKTRQHLLHTLAFIVSGALAVATIPFVAHVMSGAPMTPSPWENDLAGITGALLLMSFIEYRVAKRVREWGEARWMLGCAAALGLAIIEGVLVGASDGLIRLAILLPAACFVLHVSGNVFSKTK